MHAADLQSNAQRDNFDPMKRTMVLNFADERSRWAITDAALKRLRTALPAEWQLRNVQAAVSSRGDGSGISSEALEAVRGAEIYAGFGLPRDLFLAATAGAAARLRWVHSGAAGVGALLYPEMLAADVVITNSAGVHAPPMAETVIGRLVEAARRSWPLHRVEVCHRVGRVPVGEVSVLVRVHAPHRDQAFAACRFLIDQIKGDAPIWKQALVGDHARPIV